MFGDIGKMMKAAGQMRQKLPEVQRKLEASEFTAEAGGGAVRATVNGKLRLLEVEIDPAALAEAHGASDPGVLEELIQAAVAAAQERAAEAATEAMRELTGGMRLPGLDGLL